jgi:hypothetical protein
MRISASRLVIVSLTMAILVAGCVKKAKNTQTAPVITPTPSRAVFVPTPDSTATITQLKSWMACNPLLDSLSFFYQDSFKLDDPAKRIVFQDEFTRAQNKICLRCGLVGGYEEYSWILKIAGNPRNKAIMDSIGLRTY